MSGRVLIEWKNVPSSGRKKYRKPMMKMIQLKTFPNDGTRRGAAVVVGTEMSGIPTFAVVDGTELMTATTVRRAAGEPCTARLRST